MARGSTTAVNGQVVVPGGGQLKVLAVAWVVVTGTFFGPHGLIFTGRGRLWRDVDRADRVSPVQAVPVGPGAACVLRLAVGEIAWARGKARSDKHLLALML